MRQKVVIIGRGYNNRLALLRPLGELGYDISIVILEHYPKRPIDSYSKYVTNCYICSEETEEALLYVLMTNCIDEKQKVILIPSEDFSVYVLDKNLNKLKKFFLFPNIHERQGAVVEWMDKGKQKALARTMGLNVANSRSVEITNGKYVVPSDILYPCFIKAQTFVLKAKNVLSKCDNEQELITVLDSVCEQHKDIVLMIEEFKEIERELSVGGFSDGNDVIIPGVIEKLTIANGVTMKGKIVSTNGYEEIIDKFKRFIRGIDFVGIFDIDFYYSGNEFYFCELNLRYGGTGFAYIKKGINFPEMLARTLSGRSINDVNKSVTSDSFCVNEDVCLRNWYYGRMTTKEYLHVMESSDIYIYRDCIDSVPEKMYNRIFLKMRIKRIVKKIIKIIVK